MKGCANIAVRFESWLDAAESGGGHSTGAAAGSLRLHHSRHSQQKGQGGCFDIQFILSRVVEYVGMVPLKLCFYNELSVGCSSSCLRGDLCAFTKLAVDSLVALTNAAAVIVSLPESLAEKCIRNLRL